MTLLADPPSTAVGPTARSVTRRARGPIALAVVVALVSIAAALMRASPGGELDPRAYSPSGARALAALLADQGTTVRVVETVPGLRTDGATTIVVPFPAGLSEDELTALGRAQARLVVLGADPAALDALGLPDLDPSMAPVQSRRAACDLPAAVRAGTVDLGGAVYRVPQGATGCYARSGRAGLVVLTGPDRVLLGSGVLLTNDALDQRGNAALALGLLGATPDVQWLLPRPGARDTGADGSLNDLLPDGLRWAVLQLGLAVVALALWRSRRLGPVVTEPLPVVVRAAEAVEGRSRLYRAARARGAAAQALRASTRDHLARRLGLPPDVARAGLVEAVCAHVPRAPETVDVLLYGAEPADDGALVRLADDLDTLDREVAGS